MTPAVILDACARLGVTLRTLEGSLVARPAGVLTADLRAAIRTNRTALLALLAAPAHPEGRHHLRLAPFGRTTPKDASEPAENPIECESRQRSEGRQHRRREMVTFFGADAPADFEERAAIIEANGVPREWAEGFARLDTMERPPGIALWRWRQIVDDAGRFLDRWGREAAALGWSALDVFGVNVEVPLARTDCMGLAALIGGGAVVRLTKDGATIRTPSGAVQTYRRKSLADAGAVAVWQLTPGYAA